MTDSDSNALSLGAKQYGDTAASDQCCTELSSVDDCESTSAHSADCVNSVPTQMPVSSADHALPPGSRKKRLASQGAMSRKKQRRQ